MKQLLTILFLFCCSVQYAQLTANAGTDKTLCPGLPTLIGGLPAASGGKLPYTYEWSPTSGLSAVNIPNPLATVSGWVHYTLKVTDSTGLSVTDDVWLNVDEMLNYGAGIDTGYCFGQQSGPVIGDIDNNNASHTFNWAPGLGLSDSTSPMPVATPSITTTYTVKIDNNAGTCPSKYAQVTITPWQPPYVDAGRDTIIDEGSVLTLQGTGSTILWWTPNYNIKYANTLNPDVWPLTTTTYTLGTEDVHHCYNFDTVLVVVRPGDILFFYNTFTPNGDGENDLFYIGNVEKYPDNMLKIYNRYGKMIFSAANYANTWDGSYLSSPVPTGTYFYIFDDGKGQKHKGTVTILK